MACTEVESVSSYGTNRGGGFGSTGTQEVEPRTKLDDELDVAEALASLVKKETPTNVEEKENVKD